MNCLVIYTSVSGNTRIIANEIASEIGASIAEIRDRNMPARDDEMRPRLDPESIDVKDFDTIFIGTPIWMWAPSSLLTSYLKKAPLRGKRVAIFTTSEGDLKKAVEKVKSELKDNMVLSTADFLSPKIKQEKARARTWARDVLKMVDKQR